MTSVPKAGNHDRLEEALAVLGQHWGYESFRQGQWTAMSAVLKGRDALTILPTGGGKSLCYQVPALLMDGLTVVVSPLVALMDDQVAQLTRRGIKATFINSTLSHRETEERWNAAMFGSLKLLYLAPERLQTDVFQARADRLSVSLLAVDEAHCISEWGHSFRPSYLKIAEARALLGDPPTIAVTATATPYVRRDIRDRLALRDPETVVTGFDRPNLTWSVFRTENKRRRVLEIVGAVPGCGIVYAGTRRRTEEWAAWLVKQGIPAAYYHGGLTPEVRSAAQDAWIRDECRIMVATNAFGMGIDKPDVRFVIHVDLPGTLESYYQEAGRAGRDGKRAHAILLFQARDEDTPKRLLQQSHPDRRTVRRVYDALCSLAGIAIGEKPNAPVPISMEKLARSARTRGALLKGALELLERQEILDVARPEDDSVLIRFTQPPDIIRAFAADSKRRSVGRFVTELMRALPAEAFEELREISRTTLTDRFRIDSDRLLRGLSFLAQRSLVEWTTGAGHVLVTLRQPRTVQVPYDEVFAGKARKRAETRLADMVRYSTGESCRRRFLLSYFGESAPEKCGSCDVCLGRHSPFVVTPEHEPLIRQILEGVRDESVRSSWFEGKQPRRREIDALVSWLVAEEYLHVSGTTVQRLTLTAKGKRLVADERFT